MTGEMIKPVIQKIKKAELKKLLEEKNLLEFNRDIQTTSTLIKIQQYNKVSNDEPV